MTIFTDNFSALAPDYDVVLSDVWGVVHNGVAAFPEACDALTRFREGGGTVVLITNAPRPNGVVATQVAHFGAPRSIYDAIVSSGDVTRDEIGKRPGQSIFHIGPKRDLAIFEGLDVAFAPVERADYVICSGLFNEETETPDDYRDLLGQMLSRRLFMVCGNPDVVVERGEQLLYCAGAIADLYARMSGEVLYAGKPYAPIYDLALHEAGDVAKSRVLAIGDGVITDVKGAQDQGLDCLFIAKGIHGQAAMRDGALDAEAVAGLLAEEGVTARYALADLIW